MSNIISSFSVIAGAAEALARGTDISNYTRADLRNTLEESSNTYSILVDDATKDMFRLPTNQVHREGRIVYAKKEVEESFTPDLTLTIDKVKQIMKVLWELNIESFSDFKEEDYIEGYKELIEEMDRDFDTNLDMKHELTREKTDEALKIFLALFDYPSEYSRKIYENSKQDRVFHLTKAKDFEVIDNRMYIPIKPSITKKIQMKVTALGSTIPQDFAKIKALVVSKNVYDYFWASYGNSFQSCFSLNSEYGYLYGYVPFAMAPESFICYGTTGGVNKIPIVSGKQFKCPNMLFRCWGYADEKGNLLVDKKYLSHTCSSDTFVDVLFDVLKPYLDVYNDAGNSTDRTLYDDGKSIGAIFNDIKCKFYADSLKLRTDGTVYFRYACGDCGAGTNNTPWSNTHKKFIDYASTVTQISPTLTLDKPCKVIGGILMNPKMCPVTGLMIPDSETKSPYAKFFTTDCKRSAIITYIGGQVFLDDMTEDDACSSHFILRKRFSQSQDRRGFFNGRVTVLPYSSIPDCCNKSISLNTLKEFLKGDFNTGIALDGLLLRYFEGHEVKYQFYKSRK